MKTIFSIIIICFLTGCNSHYYAKQAKILTKDVNSILIKNGLCTNANDCAKKEMVKYAAGKGELAFITWGGAYISVYNINSTDVAEQIKKAVKSRHKEFIDTNVYLKIYKTKHHGGDDMLDSLTIEQ